MNRRKIWCVVPCLFASCVLAQSSNRPDYPLSGIVVLDDGTPLPRPVEVLLICSGTVVQRAYSQPGGQFFLNVGENKVPEPDTTDTVPTASRYRGFGRLGRRAFDDNDRRGNLSLPGRVHLSDCELVGSLPGFISEVVRPGNRDIMQNPDVGAIILHSRTRVRGSTVSVKSLSAPGKAEGEYGRATAELRKKTPSYAKALQYLRKAVTIYPEFAAAWNLIAKCHMASRRFDDAREAYESAAAADPDYLIPYVGLAALALQTGQYERAVNWSGRALDRSPTMTSASYLHAFASFYSGNLDKAEASVAKVEKSADAEAYPGIHYLRGAIRAARGDVPAAAEEFRLFLELSPTYDGADELKKQLALWEDQGVIDR